MQFWYNCHTIITQGPDGTILKSPENGKCPKENFGNEAIMQ
jgi:hypothetical protein